MDSLYHGNSLDFYREWEPPIAIISDGAYGLGKFPGEPTNPNQLKDWYKPHVEAWENCSTPQTTLWFWNTEIGWANVHPLLEEYGWVYKRANHWNKGLAHIAGNYNSKTALSFPCVSEICVQYTRKQVIELNGESIKTQEWLRSEWKRAGLILAQANEACGVKNAASRKYLARDSAWYFPPIKHFESMVSFANKYGVESGKPYFALDAFALDKSAIEKMTQKNKFNSQHGDTNIWEYPPLHCKERVKMGNKSFHINQKPLALMDRLIKSSTDTGDVVWEPFGGLFSAALSAFSLGRVPYGAEIDLMFYEAGMKRFNEITTGFFR